MSESERKEEAALVLPELETVCEHCRGKWSDCHRCGGSGYIPTEFGERVLALLRHNINLDAAALRFRE